jgi:hypothetical protein
MPSKVGLPPAMVPYLHVNQTPKSEGAAMRDFPPELLHGTGAVIKLDPTRLLLAFKEPTTREKIAAPLDESGLVLEGSQDTEREKPARSFEVINHTDRRFWVRSSAGEAIDPKRLDALEEKFGAALEWAGPVYRMGNVEGRGGLMCPLPNVLLIRPKAQIGGGERDQRLGPWLRESGLQEVPEKSKYLGAFDYYVIPDTRERDAYRVRDQLLEQGKDRIDDVQFETMPLVVPITVVPNDAFFPQQWSMTQIQAGGPGTTGWDISAGDAGVVVCILDSGCDLTHPDLDFAGQGINLGTMAPGGSPTTTENPPHGTACAGIAAGRFNNAAGVAGVAGGCRLLPVAFQNWTDAECAAGIIWAAANGAAVISMSFGQYAPGEGHGPAVWNFLFIDAAIHLAVNLNCVLVATTGNENTGTVNRYPARNPLVIAVGGSDQADNRKTPASPDGENWGANFGPGISVVAPSVQNPTTDIQGNGDGYNTNSGGPFTTFGVTYPNCGDTAGDYFFLMNGTSAAAPHVAGLAAVIRSQYPGLSVAEVRALIERTADKVGGAYADVAGFPNGTRNAQMGYGRINMLRALDQSDVLIKDWPGDDGTEPSAPPGGNFWSFSDIVVRITDDDVFDPGDPSRSSNVERGQPNYLYIRATNNGPRDARNVLVTARITPYVGLEFLYPTDWTANDATHVSPTPVTAAFASIPASGSAMAKFTISAAQVDTLWGWFSGISWYPCLLASVSADNDYAFATAGTLGGDLVVRRNNLAQRSLSVIDVLLAEQVAFPFLAGHAQNVDRSLQLVVNRSRLPGTMSLLLSLEDDGRAFPLVDLQPATPSPGRGEGEVVFLERTRIETLFGGYRSVLTLEKGSSFDRPPSRKIGDVRVQGGEVIVRNNKRYVDIRDEVAVIHMEKQPNQVYPLALHTTIPADGARGATYAIDIAQRSERGETVGGATVIYLVSLEKGKS